MIGTSSGKTIMATNKVLGRSTAGTGAIEEISLGSNLTLSGGTLTAGGGVSGVAASASDVLSVSGSDIAADDPGADRIIFWDESENKLTHLEVGSGLTLSGATLTGGGVSGTGSVDNAVLRADGTGGSSLQNSGLVVEDTIVSFTGITGDAGTDIITATGSTFANGQPVRFTALTGGSGLNTTTNYFVREVSGATFKLETTIGGGAINFTTNITAGTLLTGHSVQVNVTLSENTTETNSALVLTPKGSGALILGPKPDGTSVGGNARGARAVDLQTSRSANTRVASGADSAILNGSGNTASGSWSISSGRDQSATANYSAALGGQDNIVSGANSIVSGGYLNEVSGTYGGVMGGFRALADRNSMQAHAAGQFAAKGDAQRARFVMRNKTTTNSAVELFLDGSATRLTIPSGKVLGLTINITGIKSDGSAVSHYLRQYALKNVAGTTAEVYAPVTIGTDNAAGTSIALSANDTNDALKVEVTGIASETWRWVAAVDAVEIAYGT
jgi:hypothetical protein